MRFGVTTPVWAQAEAPHSAYIHSLLVRLPVPITAEDSDKKLAKCKYCTWRTEHPKAFRMRSHSGVVSHSIIPQPSRSALTSLIAFCPVPRPV